MKNLFTFVLVILYYVSFSQSSISFVKQLRPDADTYEMSSVEYGLIVDDYDGEFIKLVVTIQSNVSENVLSQLFKVGRYNISVKNGVILFDRIKNTILINGVELKEDILVEVSVPFGIDFNRRLLN
jgi:hypothetical protein